MSVSINQITADHNQIVVKSDFPEIALNWTRFLFSPRPTNVLDPVGLYFGTAVVGERRLLTQLI
jgi:hypothetical protein